MNMNSSELEELASVMASPGSGLEIKDRRYFLKLYPRCFIGTGTYQTLFDHSHTTIHVYRQSAISLGNEMVKNGLFHHTVDLEKPLIDGYYFYEFSASVRPNRQKLNSYEEALPTTPKGIALLMMDDAKGIEVKDRKYRLKMYRCCFVASEAIDWMLKTLRCRNREDAKKIGEKLVDQGFIEHVVEPQPFKDAYLFFRFTKYTKNTPKLEPVAQESVCPEDFEVLKMLGEGGYGKVSLVRKLETQNLYAMKTVQKSKIRSAKALEHIITEKRVLVNDSPFLLHLYYSFQTSSKLYLVTDFLPGGDMFFHLAKKNGSGFSTPVSKFFCAEIVLALEHLHHCGVVYRDLKLENVLLDAKGHICLADFGLSKVMAEEDRTQTFCGSQGYLAPEILRGEKYSYSVDWFSLGVILYEMLCGVNPFLGNDFHETGHNILNKPLRFPPYFPRNVATLLSRLLARDPSLRLQSAAEIKRQPWFKDIDWNKLALKKIMPPFKISMAAEGSTEHFDQIYTRMEITSEDETLQDCRDPASGEIFEDFDFIAEGV